MTIEPPVLLSKRPAYVAEGVRVAPGVEVKLNWKDAADLGDGREVDRA